MRVFAVAKLMLNLSVRKIICLHFFDLLSRWQGGQKKSMKQVPIIRFNEN